MALVLQSPKFLAKFREEALAAIWNTMVPDGCTVNGFLNKLFPGEKPILLGG